MTAKPRKFKVHFNRINMQRGLDTVWTIHLSDRCIPAISIEMRVPVKTVFRPTARQPRAWFEGKGYVYEAGHNRYVIDNP